MYLTIRLDRGAGIARVVPLTADEPTPRSAILLRPGETAFGIPYDEWARHAGAEVDIRALRKERGLYPTRPKVLDPADAADRLQAAFREVPKDLSCPFCGQPMVAGLAEVKGNPGGWLRVGASYMELVHFPFGGGDADVVLEPLTTTPGWRCQACDTLVVKRPND